MSIDITIRHDIITDQVIGIFSGTPSMIPLVHNVSNIMEKAFPAIYGKAFSSLDWRDVYINLLDDTEFMDVYSATKHQFDLFMGQHRTNESIAPVRYLYENWNEYIGLLESDPRFKSDKTVLSSTSSCLDGALRSRV